MISLEYTGDTGPVQRNFDRLAKEAVDNGGQSTSLRAGNASLTFTASTNSATLTVSHGLGGAPVSVVATPWASPGFTKIPTLDIAAVDADSFDIRGELDVAHTGSIPFFWIAIG